MFDSWRHHNKFLYLSISVQYYWCKNWSERIWKACGFTRFGALAFKCELLFYFLGRTYYFQVRAFRCFVNLPFIINCLIHSTHRHQSRTNNSPSLLELAERFVCCFTIVFNLNFASGFHVLALCNLSSALLWSMFFRKKIVKDNNWSESSNKAACVHDLGHLSGGSSFLYGCEFPQIRWDTCIKKVGWLGEKNKHLLLRVSLLMASANFS